MSDLIKIINKDYINIFCETYNKDHLQNILNNKPKGIAFLLNLYQNNKHFDSILLAYLSNLNIPTDIFVLFDKLKKIKEMSIMTKKFDNYDITLTILSNEETKKKFENEWF